MLQQVKQRALQCNDTYKLTEVLSKVNLNSEIEQLYTICPTRVVNSRKEDQLALRLHVGVRLDYIQMNYADSLNEVLESNQQVGHSQWCPLRGQNSPHR